MPGPGQAGTGQSGGLKGRNRRGYGSATAKKQGDDREQHAAQQCGHKPLERLHQMPIVLAGFLDTALSEAMPIISGAVTALIGYVIAQRVDRLKRLKFFRDRIMTLTDPVEWECRPHNSKVDTKFDAIWAVWTADMTARIAEIKPDISLTGMRAFEAAQREYYKFDAHRFQDATWQNMVWRQGRDPGTPVFAKDHANAVWAEMAGILGRLRAAARPPALWEEVGWINREAWCRCPPDRECGCK